MKIMASGFDVATLIVQPDSINKIKKALKTLCHCMCKSRGVSSTELNWKFFTGRLRMHIHFYVPVTYILHLRNSRVSSNFSSILD
jgi:hypothetical protein